MSLHPWGTGKLADSDFLSASRLWLDLIRKACFMQKMQEENQTHQTFTILELSSATGGPFDLTILLEKNIPYENYFASEGLGPQSTPLSN